MTHGWDDPARTRRPVDPNDVFSPRYPVGPQGPVVRTPLPSADVDHDDAIPAVIRGGLIACGVLAVVLALLLVVRMPHDGRTLDAVVLALVNHAIAAGPLRTLQFTLTDQEVPEVVLAVFAVAAWFSRRATRMRRNLILLAVTSAVFVYAASRVTQQLLHRPRPLIDATMQLVTDPETMERIRSSSTHLGSLPSDHAALLALAIVTAFAVNRRAAVALIVFAVWASLYRIAIGFHWPSDVVAGALLGTGVAILVLRLRAFADPALRRVQLLFRRRPPLMYGLAFFFLVDFAQSFPLMKTLAKALFHARLFH